MTALGAFVAFLDVTIVNIAFPAITSEFSGASLADLSWVITAYNIVFAALLIPAGRLADQLGHRKVFLVGITLFGLASAACAWAPAVPVLVAARVVQAVAAAAIAPSSLALLLPAFPPERRGAAVGMWGATSAVAAATGPALGGLLVDALGWRSVFFVNVPLVIVVVLAGKALLSESRDSRSGIPDLVSVGMLGLGVAMLSLGIVNGEGGAWTSFGVAAPLVLGVALLGGFVLRSARVANPLVELGLFRLRAFAGATVGYFVFSSAFFALLLANVLFLTGVWHVDVLLAGLAVTPGPIMAAVSSAVGGRLVDRFGPRVVVLPGGLLFAAGCVVFAVAIGPEPHYLTAFLPATLLTGIGVGSIFSGLSVAAVAQLPPARYATGSAVGNCARQIGAVLGIALLLSWLGTEGAQAEAFRTAWAVMALGGVGAAICGVVVGAARAVVTLGSAPALRAGSGKPLS
ncbi:DHA2 family efflux MFS transporter permease subunit [Actinomycetes bacterium KLBMP 9759]